MGVRQVMFEVLVMTLLIAVYGKVIFFLTNLITNFLFKENIILGTKNVETKNQNS